jgi:anaerobic dimethyl sulfoxide reductase subunit A
MQGCIKGYNMKKMLYAPDRLKKPLIRTGQRGSGEFRTVSWDEALDTTAQRLETSREAYGATSILSMNGAGACRGVVHNTIFLGFRFFGLYGGYTRLTGSYSSAAASFVTSHMFGTNYVGLDPATLLDSRFVILWGANISVTRFGCELENYLKELKHRSTPVIVIDPHRSQTVRTLATEWISILPGTDSAMMAAVLYVLLEENLVDRAFLERYTSGFADLETYIRGENDGIPKTPSWAETICGTPAATIRDFAIRYGTTKPSALIPGLSIQRTLGGEEAYRMAFALQAATGNIGIPGGSSGGCIWARLPIPRMHFVFFPAVSEQPSVPVYRWPDAVLEGTANGYPTDIKAIYSVGQNYLNQGSDIEKNIKAFEKVEFAVSHEIFLTPTARYCDVIFPATTFLEREDVIYGSNNYLFYSQKAIEPLYESRNDYDIFADLSRRLGFYDDFSEKRTASEWLAFLLEESEIADREAFRSTGLYLGKDQKRVGLTEFIENPTEHPLDTTTGKIELSSAACSAEGYPHHPVCRIIEPPSDYPLRLITPHSHVRINSTLANLDWTKKLEPKELLINPIDASKRGIIDGDLVCVKSPQGRMRIVASVDVDIIPRVVCLPQGRWVQFDASGNEIAGSPNVLTSTVPTLPSQGSRTHTVFVEVSRVLD